MSEQSLIESDAVIKQVATQECKPALGIRKIGILGGSFNPIHNAHLRLALAAWQFLDLDQVHLMPAGQPWQKQALQVSAENRLAMLRLATQDTPQLLINTMEIERDGLTYTIDTLKELPPDAKYFWLMGSDQLNNFCTWNAWQEILDYVQLVVVQRPGYQPQVPPELQDELRQKNKHLIMMPFDELDISSSEIRQKLSNKQDVSTLVPAAVLDYIKEHNLYRDNASNKN